ncbi:MAG: flippase-like domain-containing protein [Chloroflexi bacterium]|nr:flippase-like domain-containing protein [Chloroflexota bacterium]
MPGRLDGRAPRIGSATGDGVGGPTMLGFLRRNPRLLAIQAVVIAISMAVLLWRVDVLEALRRLDNVEPAWALGGLVLFTVSKGIHAYRWRVLLGRSDVPLRPLVSIFMVSNLVNALVPLRAGDLVRIELPSRLLKLPRAALASNVLFVESLFDGLAFLVLVAVAGFVLGEGVRELPGLTIFVAIVALAFVVLVFLARWELPADPARSRLLLVVPDSARERAASLLAQLQEGMASLREVRHTIVSLIISVAAWVAEVGVYWMMGKALGLELGLGEAIVLMIAANIVVSLPITPWDIGPFEVAVTEAFVLLGGDRVDGSSYAVGIHVLLLAWITVTGVIAMFTLNLRPREVLDRRRLQADEEPEA